MNVVGNTTAYCRDLTEFVGSAWNAFWFQPRSPQRLLMLSRFTGVVVLGWLVGMSWELTDMFARSGWLSPQVVHQATTDGDVTQMTPGFSYLFWIGSRPLLWLGHVAAIAVVVLGVIPVLPRVTIPGTLVVVLCYVHRAALVTGQLEAVMSILLLYLAIGALCFDYRTSQPHWLANVITRLLQIHLCGFYLMIVATKLGTPIWWTGDATWYLLTDAQHRLVDLSYLTNFNLVINGVTHLWLFLEVLFPILVWHPRLRPLMLVLSGITWIGTACVTGLVGYALLMMGANTIFLAPPTFRESGNSPSERQ